MGIQKLDWEGLHARGGWKTYLTPEAYKHPAKFPKDLIFHIVKYGLERGFWERGQMLCDPFGGVGCGAIACAHYGLSWFGTEIEPHFVDAARSAFDKNVRSWRPGVGAHLVRGDARELGSLLNKFGGDKKPVGAILSPPEQTCLAGGGGIIRRDDKLREGLGYLEDSNNYGKEGDGRTPGQIAHLKGPLYWAAIINVYCQLYGVLPQGAWVAVHVKDHVYNKERVRVCRDTRRALENSGFVVRCRIRSWLTEMRYAPSLDNPGGIRTLERKSMFKLIQEKKMKKTDPRRIDFEEVVFCQKV